eukprot:1009934_1
MISFVLFWFHHIHHGHNHYGKPMGLLNDYQILLFHWIYDVYIFYHDNDLHNNPIYKIVILHEMASWCLDYIFFYEILHIFYDSMLKIAFDDGNSWIVFKMYQAC